MKTFILHSKMARHNKVWLAPGPTSSRCSEWRIIPIAKKWRKELEYTPVPVGFVISANNIIQCLCLLISCYFC